MNKTGYILSFAVGGIIGAVATWAYIKKKYEQIAHDEIRSVVDAFTKAECERTEKSMSTVSDNSDSSSYTALLKEEHYISEDTKIEMERPYVISPDEFGSIWGYEPICLTYYADGILTDDADNIIDDVDQLVGLDSLTRFGEYEDDSVHVRNDQTKCDYEILMDLRCYSDISCRKERTRNGG